MKKLVIDRFSALVIAAFGLVAALAWNSAVQSIFKQYVPGEGIIPKLIYAVAVTMIAVLITLWVGYLASRANNVKKSTKKR